MKQFFSSLVLISVLLLASCSTVAENTDPVLGIWYMHGTSSPDIQEVSTKEEWIFNDAYLGRYHIYNNNSVVFQTDFQWEQIDGTYTISYPGTNMQEQNARMVTMEEQEVLQDEHGNILAIRE